MVNPLSAITEMPSFPSSLLQSPETFVSSTSDIEPTYTGEINVMAPLGVQATNTLAVLWCGKENGNANGLSCGPVDVQSSGMTAEAF